MDFIDLKSQYKLIKDDILSEINEVLDSGQYIMGTKVRELETTLASYAGVKHCIGVADGTTALLIALMALKIGPGDEVIVPAFTFIATATQAALLGAKVVFVDVDARTFNLDPDKLESAITPKTKAIIPVSLFGMCADIDAVNSVASKYNIAVIEDAAQSFGATYNTKRSAGLTTIATTSFFPSKPLGAYGDAGACFTNDENLADAMAKIRVHGQDKRYHHVMLGINGRLDTIQAAILLVKMRIFDEEVVKRTKIGERYTKLLQGSNCQTPVVIPNASHVYAQYTIITKQRKKLIKDLQVAGIPTSVHYPRLANEVVSLPMHPYLDEACQNKIVEAVIHSLST
ncbi:MAG: aminotransferase DegT [Burkholderiales bacterium]|nr:aminotransferase DegT [Burkholderiales bacterium]